MFKYSSTRITWILKIFVQKSSWMLLQLAHYSFRTTHNFNCLMSKKNLKSIPPIFSLYTYSFHVWPLRYIFQRNQNNIYFDRSDIFVCNRPESVTRTLCITVNIFGTKLFKIRKASVSNSYLVCFTSLEKLWDHLREYLYS